MAKGWKTIYTNELNNQTDINKSRKAFDKMMRSMKNQNSHDLYDEGVKAFNEKKDEEMRLLAGLEENKLKSSSLIAKAKKLKGKKG
jgi:hypothetical protein